MRVAGMAAGLAGAAIPVIAQVSQRVDIAKSPSLRGYQSRQSELTGGKRRQQPI
jgi:hypothetical protein